MNKEFIPFYQAIELKDLGFDETCFRYYTKHGYLDDYTPIGLSAYFGCHAPLYQQAFRWFDDNTEYRGFIVPSIKEGHYDWFIRIGDDEEIECEEYYISRQKAEHACLLKLIELAKQK